MIGLLLIAAAFTAAGVAFCIFASLAIAATEFPRPAFWKGPAE